MTRTTQPTLLHCHGFIYFNGSTFTLLLDELLGLALYHAILSSDLI